MEQEKWVSKLEEKFNFETVKELSFCDKLIKKEYLFLENHYPQCNPIITGSNDII